MVKKSKSILWTAVAAGAMLSTASIFASCSTETKEVGTEVHAAGDTTAEHKCGTEHKCGGDSTKAEGKCGADSTKAEGKCGASKAKDAKCGEGKCGTNKK